MTLLVGFWIIAKETRCSSPRWHTAWRALFPPNIYSNLRRVILSQRLLVCYTKGNKVLVKTVAQSEKWLRKSFGGQTFFSPNRLYLLDIAVDSDYSGKYIHYHVTYYFPDSWLRAVASMRIFTTGSKITNYEAESFYRRIFLIRCSRNCPHFVHTES
jgi:hypothetical protein